VGEILSNRITDKLPIEHKGAEGEAMLLSLYDFFEGGTQGFVDDPNVPLTVIIVSDEQDVCFDYKANGVSPRLVSVRDAKGNVSEAVSPIETAFYNSNACQKAVRGKQLTPEAVYESMTAKVKKEQLVITSLVYQNNNVPQGSQDENEMGYGLIDLAKLAGQRGLNSDLAKLDMNNESTFQNKLQEIGDFTKTKMSYVAQYGCSSDMDPNDVNPSTVVMKFFNQHHQEVATFRGDCRPRSCKGASGKVSFISTADPKAVGGRYGLLSINDPRVLGTILDRLDRNDIEKGTVEVSFFSKQK
jgi:hypothetical protein